MLTNKNRTTKKTTQRRARLWQTKWRLCKAGRFSYGESPRTPPLEGTSLHRWNNSVERPWGILSLFTIATEITLPQAVTHVAYARKCTPRRKEPYKLPKRTKPRRYSWVEVAVRKRKTEGVGGADKAFGTAGGAIISVNMKKTVKKTTCVEELKNILLFFFLVLLRRWRRPERNNRHHRQCLWAALKRQRIPTKC